ncbi:MAG: hypothetical protein ABI445_21880 [Polyangia bacterium]
MGRPANPNKAPRVYPSGAQKRKRKYELEALAAEQAEDDGTTPKDDGSWIADFKKAGKVDLSDPATALDYTRKLQLIVLHQISTTAFPSVAQKSTHRAILEMSKALGMTFNKSSLESKVKRVTQHHDASAQAPSVDVRSTKGVLKNPEARGMSGPRALPPIAPPKDPRNKS